MAGQMYRILDGNTFVVCDERGDIEALATEPTGLFSFDTRFLSTWVLTINGQKLNPLSIDPVAAATAIAQKRGRLLVAAKKALMS